MLIVKHCDAELRNNPFDADVRVLFSQSDLDVLHLTLEPQQILNKVQLAGYAFFYILEGNPEVIIDDEGQFVQAEAMVYCPQGSWHCINNPGDSQARILIFKQML